MRFRSCFLIVIAICCFELCASFSLKVDSYELNMTFYPEKSYCEGLARITVDHMTGGDTLLMYLHGELTVDSVLDRGKEIAVGQQPVFYSHDYSLIANQITFIAPSGTGRKLSVYYSGYFHPSKARSPSDYMRIDDDGVFLRAYGYSLWFPVSLKAGEDSYGTDFSKVTLRTPKDFTTVFAGNRVEEETEDDWRISVWHAKNLNLYAAQCTAQRFKVDSEDDIFLYHAADSKSRKKAKQIAHFAKMMIREFSSRYNGSVERGQYHIMEMPRYGDISSGNVTGISRDIWTSFDSSSWSARALAHELVHPFVQPAISNTDSLFALCIEGFPSYFHLPILADIRDSSWFADYMDAVEKAYLKKKETGVDRRGRTLPVEKPLTAITDEEIGRYKDTFVLDDRALLFLYWVQRHLGRDEFFAWAKEMMTEDSLTTGIFKANLAKRLPGYEKVIDVWLDSTDYPMSIRIPH